MYIISKTFRFSASHTLRFLPEEHPCSRLHGHNYTVTVYLARATLTEAGFVIDYNALHPLKRHIDEEFDHRHLNEVEALRGANPSAEKLAYHFYAFCKNIWNETLAVEVRETDGTSARYER